MEERSIAIRVPPAMPRGARDELVRTAIDWSRERWAPAARGGNVPCAAVDGRDDEVAFELHELRKGVHYYLSVAFSVLDLHASIDPFALVKTRLDVASERWP